MDKFEQHIKRMKGLRDVCEIGTGQHNILSMLIQECESVLKQLPVMGSACEVKKISCHCYNDEMREECWVDCDYGGQIVP